MMGDGHDHIVSEPDGHDHVDAERVAAAAAMGSGDGHDHRSQPDGHDHVQDGHDHADASRVVAANPGYADVAQSDQVIPVVEGGNMGG